MPRTVEPYKRHLVEHYERTKKAICGLHPALADLEAGMASLFDEIGQVLIFIAFPFVLYNPTDGRRTQ